MQKTPKWASFVPHFLVWYRKKDILAKCICPGLTGCNTHTDGSFLLWKVQRKNKWAFDSVDIYLCLSVLFK